MGIASHSNFNTANIGVDHQNYKIAINNKILVKIHGKVISVMDVQKKMDFFLYENNKEILESPVLLYQFYTQNWKDILQDMIDNELILMEGDELKIEITDSEVREEIEKRFGSNVIHKFENMGITYENIKEIVHDDMIIKNLSWYRIWARAIQLATPEVVKHEYQTHISNTQFKDKWTYQTITVKGTSTELTENTAKKAYALINQHGNLPNIINELKNETPKNLAMHVSDELSLSSSELSPEYKSILQKLTYTNISEPIQQKSRVDGSTVYKIFMLKDYQPAIIPSLDELSSKIHAQLVNQISSTQRKKYLFNLRKQFCCEDLTAEKIVDNNFQPFLITYKK